MERMFFPFGQFAPEIKEAHDTSTKLLDSFRMCTDPLSRKIFKEMAFDALEYESKLRLGSKAKEMVGKLQDSQNPPINFN